MISRESCDTENWNNSDLTSRW